jgi:hypothetical protein
MWKLEFWLVLVVFCRELIAVEVSVEAIEVKAVNYVIGSLRSNCLTTKTGEMKLLNP